MLHLGCRSDDPWSNLVKRLGASGLSEDGFNKLFLFKEKMMDRVFISEAARMHVKSVKRGLRS